MKLNHAVIIKIINSLGAQKTKLNSHRKITRKYKSRTIWHVMQLNWLSIYVMLQELNNHTKNWDWFQQVPHILSLFDSIWRRTKRQRCNLMSPLRKHLGIPVSVLQVSQLSEAHVVLISFGGEGINAWFPLALTISILKFHRESLKSQLSICSSPKRKGQLR